MQTTLSILTLGFSWLQRKRCYQDQTWQTLASSRGVNTEGAEKQARLGSGDADGYPKQTLSHFPRGPRTSNSDYPTSPESPAAPGSSDHRPARRDKKALVLRTGIAQSTRCRFFTTTPQGSHASPSPQPQRIHCHYQKTLDLPPALTCPGRSRDQRLLCRRAAPGRSPAPQDS